MTDVQFMTAVYILYIIGVFIFMACKLWKGNYIQQSLNILTWVSVITLFEVLIQVYMNEVYNV